MSSISLAELVYLVEKRRLPETAYAALSKDLAESSSVFTEAVFYNRDSVGNAYRHTRRVPDMPDRMIAATAALLRVPLLSRDRRILSSRVNTLW